MSDTTNAFDQRAASYDLLIDWSKRLANEEPFYRQVFAEAGVQRVLDAACGTGRHAAMFHSWGLQVEGADISPGMIAECRRRFAAPPGLHWVVRSFEQSGDRTAAFDAVVCVGNSLSLAGDIASVERAVGAFMHALRPGGVCILGVLNLWSLPENTTIWQKCRRVQHAGGDHVLLKSIRRHEDRGYVDLVDLALTAGAVTPGYDSAEFLGLDGDHLASVARTAGATECYLYGSYAFVSYDRAKSLDLLMVCRRG